MRALKLLTLFSFIFVVVAIFLSNRIASPVVSGQTGISAPTGFSATDNLYNNKVGLRWDTMRGANLYRVFRNSINDSSTAIAIATTQANFFFDTTATPAQNFFYWIRAENGSTVSALNASDSGIRANALQQGPVPPLEPPPLGPPANPMSATKANLGKTLFWDEQLSSTKTVSCGTCHMAGTGGTDPRSLVTIFNSKNAGFDGVFNTSDDVVGSRGVPLNNADGTYSWSNTYGLREQVTGRKSNSFINAAYSPLLFWDGRANGTFRDPITNAIVINNGGALESQASGPPVSDSEMAHGGRNWASVATDVASSRPLALATDIPAPLSAWIDNRTYAELFQEAFGTPDVTPSRIAMALAAYQRTLFSDQAPIDLANAGITPLTAAENRGRQVFVGAQCAVCHAAELLTDNSFRNIGLRPVVEDTGRFQVTAANQNLGQFRVPSLRNVELRSSFMHNGKFATLEEVVEFYNRGGDFPNEPNFAVNLVQPRNFTVQQKSDLLAFLRRPLTDVRVRNELPPFDRPHLYSESTRVPQIVGTGIAGSGGQVPQPMAIEPPVIGNQSFTVAVTNALGSASAVLVVNSTDPGTAAVPAGGSFARVNLALQGSGAGNGFGSVSLQIPNNSTLIGQTFFGRWYVADASSPNGFSVSPAFRFTLFGEATAINRAVRADFDGDRKTDVSIFRPSVGEWWYTKSSTNQTNAFQFGSSTDKIAPSDFTGDGKVDIAFWRPSDGNWFILRSEDFSYYAFPFGMGGDIPAPADFDADGKSDAAVFRPSTGTWFIQQSTQGIRIEQFGASGDIPQVGDYDADGKADVALFRPNGAAGAEWWVKRSTVGIIATQFGAATDKPVASDFTGDGKTDVAFWRPSDGNWFILRSEDFSYYAFPFGTDGDIPAPGDYDGDGKYDAAIFRPTSSTWFIPMATQGTIFQVFGASGDIPATNFGF